MPVEDGVLLAGRLRHGEHAAAAEFVDRYYERMYLFMRAVGHDRQISEDLTQETFLRAWYHIGQLRDGKALNGWLFRIAGNVSRLHRRRFKGKDTVNLDGIEPPAGGADGPLRAGQRGAARQSAAGGRKAAVEAQAGGCAALHGAIDDYRGGRRRRHSRRER